MTIFIILVCIIALLFLAINLIFAPHNPKVWLRKSPEIRDKLSNSGELLKLLIPSRNGNVMSGWINYSCMVTSQKILEKGMDYRGSKSITVQNNIIVKEQRVDGNWWGINLPHIRCTLVGFERNYPVRILSNQMNITRNYSTLSAEPANLKLDPWFVTGFTDGEGSFMLSIIKDSKYKLGWRVACIFAISLSKVDLYLLNNIQKFFGVGNIIRMGKDMESIQYRVESLKDLSIIINHFDKYLLKTKKYADYALFKLAYDLIINKSHLTQEGLLKLVSLKANLNNGLSETLSVAFPNSTPVLRPEVEIAGYQDINPFWLTGFVNGEGCFNVGIFKSGTSRLGEATKLSFIITQSARDEDLMKNLIEYFKCGYMCSENRGTIDFKITKFSDILNIVVPFFAKYPLQGNKSLDFQSFLEAVKLVQSKDHLTLEGLNKIRTIKTGMNKNRKFI